MKWTNDKKEDLFIIASKFDSEILSHIEVSPSTDVIVKIAKEFNEDTKAVLYKLAEMGFVRIDRRTSFKDSIFYKREDRDSINDFSIHPTFKKLPSDTLNQLEVSVQDYIKQGVAAGNVLEKLSQTFELTQLNVKVELVKMGLLSRIHGERYRFTDRVLLAEEESIDDSVIKLAPNPKLKVAINKFRSEASQLYQVTNHTRPCLIQSNDGTGFGKSYGVISEHIEYVIKMKNQASFSNMVFVSPQKSQFDFDDALVGKAYNNGLEFIAFLAMTDLTDLDFECWVKNPNEATKKNSDIYRSWIKQGKKCATLDKDLTRLAQSVRTVESLKNRIDTEVKTFESDNAEIIQDLINQMTEQRRYMEKTLFDLSLSCLNRGRDPVDLNTIFQAESGIDALRASIIRHCLPFAVAMVKPCIMLATTNKFDLNIRLPQKNSNGLYAFKSMPFDCIVGGKKHLADSKIKTGDHLYESHEERIEFLKQEFFEADDSNYFRNNDISFTVVIDEVHEAHKLFSESATATLITPDIQLAHVFAGVHRIYKQVTETVESELEFMPFYEQKNKFINSVRSNLKNKCSLSHDLSLVAVLETFAGNVDFIQIRHGDAEQIINLTKNAFCFTPKRYFNEQELKKIRVRLAHGTGTCQLYYTTDENDTTLSLHDVFQVTMAVLAAASEVSGASEFLKSLKQGGDSSQNYPLYKFMKKARTVASEVESMFDRSEEDGQLYIDHYYTYFQPKTVFSLIPQKLLEFKDSSLEKLTYVNFSLNLIKEQPEVSLLRMLHNTNNAVVALSATSGINKNIVGQYNQPFLKKFCCDSSENLGVNVITRGEDSKGTLIDLRETRAELRNVKFNVFDENSELLSKIELQDDFKSVFKVWHCQLKEFSSKQDNKYKRVEFKRQLSAWLLCAYDKKHTLSLALSGGFINTLKKYVLAVKSGKAMKPKGFRDLDKKGRIFQLAPFKNKPSIQTILFNADLNKDVDVRAFVKVNSNNVKLAFMSTYRSAGTGLNYFVQYPDKDNDLFEVDFERLVLINSPFWSQIIKDGLTGEKSLYSLANCLSIMKRISDSSEVKKLSDFEINLVHGEDYRFLNYEHDLELIKVVMQAIGRVERKDANMTSEIFVSSDIADLAAVQFSRLSRDPKNTMFFESMSLLNQRFKSECHKRSLEVGFTSDVDRLKFEADVEQSGNILDEFFNEMIPEILKQAREGNEDAILFNEELRGIDSVRDPKVYVERLGKTEIAKNDRFIQMAIDKLYIKLEDKNSNLKLCFSDKQSNILTDITNGDRLYLPEKIVSLDYSSKMEFNQENVVTALVKESAAITDGAFKSWIPHPKFIALLKGNVGEFLFNLLLDKLNITPLTYQEVLKKVGPRAYELFDFYIEINEKLLCIDVKNWSSSLDKSTLSKQMHRKGLSKIHTIDEYAGDKYEKIIYAYVNGRFENNSLNHEQEVGEGQRLFYLNLFKEESGYRPKHKRNADGDFTKYYDGSQLKQKIALNSVLFKLLQGEK